MLEFINLVTEADVIVLGIFIAACIIIIEHLYIPLLPRKVRVFIEQCWSRFRTLFTGQTAGFPNFAICAMYLACCVISIATLP